MEKVVDIGYWLKLTGKAPVAGCVGWMREMTKQLNPTKVPNPDLKTALEALSLGKASWLTDVRLSNLSYSTNANGNSSTICLQRRYRLKTCLRPYEKSIPYFPYG